MYKLKNKYELNKTDCISPEIYQALSFFVEPLAGFIRYNPRCPSYKRFYKQLSQTRSKIYCPTSTEVRLPRFHVQVSGESELDRLKVKTASWSEQRQRFVRVLYHGGDL